MGTVSATETEARPSLELLPAIAVLAVFLLVYHYLHNQYFEFKALGPGGTPSTIVGFLRITLLSFLAIRDRYSPGSSADDQAKSGGCLSDLPTRTGLRPCVKGIAPQRQSTQKADEGLVQKLAAQMKALSAESNNLILGISCIEKHGIALFYKASTKDREICHLHASDGSMHMVLCTQDLNTVLKANWGERHPLARGGWFERFVPENFLLMYAPRDEEEIETLACIIQAAV